ncbi:MAG: CHAT domain-containing protein, partial [bacterium]|nr:CHAT domain-containing protein [bacterium]
MIDLVEKEKLPVDVHVLRPPTFERLREHLEERPRHYHILHFDGHGAFGQSAANDAHTDASSGSMSSFQLRTLDAHRLEGYQGCLVFEDAIGADDPIDAPQLSGLLRQHGVPIVVLNACQSAMLDDAAETAFASVAASLIKAGTRSVVAMAYSLYVSAAREFLPDFYRGLFASG